jgi:hypothetical protein
VCACGSAALGSDGTVFCWGAAADGQTGTAAAAGAGPTAAPAPVLGPRAAASAGGSRALLEPCVCARPSTALVVDGRQRWVLLLRAQGACQVHVSLATVAARAA